VVTAIGEHNTMGDEDFAVAAAFKRGRLSKAQGGLWFAQDQVADGRTLQDEGIAAVSSERPLEGRPRALDGLGLCKTVPLAEKAVGDEVANIGVGAAVVRIDLDRFVQAGERLDLLALAPGRAGFEEMAVGAQ